MAPDLWEAIEALPRPLGPRVLALPRDALGSSSSDKSFLAGAESLPFLPLVVEGSSSMMGSSKGSSWNS